MPTPNYQVLICEKDMFAMQGEHIFFYTVTDIPYNAVFVTDLLNETTGVGDAVFAIRQSDVNELGWHLPEDIRFISIRQIIAKTSIDIANMLTKALQLLRWRQDHKFCSRCGTPTELHPKDNATICSNCHYHQYPRIQPCIITAIIKQIDNRPHILLAHHQRAKESKMYTLIAGFVEVGESLEQCVHREVMEEVGLTVSNLQFFGSQPWAFTTNLMVGFIADYENGDIVIDEEELIHADFFAIDELENINTPPKGTIAHDLIEYVQHQYQIVK